ncbi:MAG: zinc-binding dehydrogenase [Anaerolineae bacterium]
MQAVFFTGQEHVSLREVPIPQPGIGQVLLKVRASALCGSELPSYRGSGSSQIAGHEVVGEVLEAEGTRGVCTGQRVAVQVMAGCGVCSFCLAGDDRLCHESHFYGGTHTEYMAVSERCCRPLPEGVSWGDGVLLGGDVIGTPFRALNRLGVSAADTVAVFGCGPIGLGAIALLHFWGARTIAVETVAYRRELACRLGAEVALDPTTGDAVAAIKDLTAGRGVGVALDCSGAAATTAMALDSAGTQARVALVGEKPEAMIRPSPQVIHKELTVIGSFYFSGPDYWRILDLHARGLSLQGLVTHRFRLDQAAEAFTTFASGQSGKVLLVQDGTEDQGA